MNQGRDRGRDMEAKISVLLADAGADFRLLLREALERTGEFQVVGETGDGGQVLTLVEETHPQILLLDTMLPVLDGIEATKQIRSQDHPDASTIPIIAMTANAFREDEQKCLAAGMNAHLAKPLQMKKVIETIEMFCR